MTGGTAELLFSLNSSMEAETPVQLWIIKVDATILNVLEEDLCFAMRLPGGVSGNFY